MVPKPFASGITRRTLIALLGAFAVLSSPLVPVIVVAEAPLVTDTLDGWIVISMKKDWKRIFGFDAPE